MASRILGQGDVLSLVKDIQEQYDEEQSRKLQEKLRKNQFDFDDFLSQLRTIKKMGNVKDLLSKVPGMNKALKDTEIPDDAFKSIEAIILSMTPGERGNPALINGSRRKRIAKGSGTSVQEINQLLKQFVEMKKMMKSFNAMGNTGRALKQLNPLKRRRR
jgi:signal recognition particle subunit SRP54